MTLISRRAALTTLLSLSVLTTSGCAALLDLLRSSVVQPTFMFKAASITEVSFAGLTLDTTWTLINPNPVSLSLASVDYALFIDDKQVLAGAPPQGLEVAAQGSTELHFPAGIKFADLVAVVETFLLKDTATWRAEGAVGVQTPAGVLRLPLAHQGQFEVPKLPLVQFDDPKVTNVTLAGATIEFPLVVTNRNSYPLPISGLTGALSLGGATLGTLSSGDLGALSGQATRTVTLPLTISFFSAANAVVNAVRGGSAQLKFDAQLHSGAQTMPLRVNQLVTFVRLNP